MNNDPEQIIIRQAAEEDAWQIADILVEDWKTAYRGIIDSDYLDALNNKEKARLNIMINSIEQIIYNNEVKLLFTADSSKKGEN